MPLLSALVAELPRARVVGPVDVEIAGLTADSRAVEPGWLFIAYQGKERDLHDFVPSAVAAGARAVAVEREVEAARGITQVVVPDGRAAEGLLAAAFFGYPSRRLGVIGVTGTDGKTTTTTLVHSILDAAGLRAGMITTVAAKIGDRSIDTGLHTTTPRALEVQRLLAGLVEAGAEWVVLETTSHALSQHRVVGVDYDVAALTNVTRDHLDEHGSWEAYRDAKALLFRGLGGSFRQEGIPKLAVVNADDPSAPIFAAAAGDVERLTYSLERSADLTASGLELAARGSRFTVHTPKGEIAICLDLPGRYNVANALAAIGVGIGLGVPAEAIARGVERVGAIPGRMERIDRGQPFTAIVDFAHTPNALEQALSHARALADRADSETAAGGPHSNRAGRVIAVFGCAGERDPSKRPLMGQIAGRLADVTVITDEDRRREDVNRIIAEIAGGVRDSGGCEGETFFREPDRGTAIERALGMAAPGDVVIVCGKGHERSLAFGSGNQIEERPWSDQDAVGAGLTKLGWRSD